MKYTTEYLRCNHCRKERKNVDGWLGWFQVTDITSRYDCCATYEGYDPHKHFCSPECLRAYAEELVKKAEARP